MVSCFQFHARLRFASGMYTVHHFKPYAKETLINCFASVHFSPYGGGIAILGHYGYLYTC